MGILHRPVLLKEVIKFFRPKSNENFIDCTLGGGGHAYEILKRTSPQGKLLAIDLDKKALQLSRERLKEFSDRIILVQDNFVNLKKIVNEQIPNLPISGILFDLGLSLDQIKTGWLGFSFSQEAELDMRLSGKGLKAEEIINQWSENELSSIFRRYGEEKLSREIAQEICQQRKRKKIKSTKELANLIIKVYQKKGKRRGKIHPATKVFQALRIVVNQELENLKKAIPQAVELLKPKGRIIVISFHSLEDRIVKNFFLDNQDKLKIITKKPVRPSEEEIEINIRARSAKMRVAEKI